MNPFVSIGLETLEVLFFAGWIGSILVVMLSATDYVVTILSKDDDEGSTGSPANEKLVEHS